MKIVLELKNKPITGDILIFEKDGFKCIGGKTFLKNLNDDINRIDKLIDNLTDNVVLNNLEFQKQINKSNCEKDLLKLEIKLLKGEIDEDIYYERKAELEKGL